MDEIAQTTPTFAGVSFDLLDEVGSVQWPCNAEHPTGTDDHARRRRSRAGWASFVPTPYVADRRAQHPPLPADPDDRPDPVAVQRRRADPAHGERRLAPRGHARDPPARRRGPRDRRRRRGHAEPAGSAQTTLRAKITDRMPVGVVYTTFHHPVTGANVVTTENSDWATNCPEYKVTAVQVAKARSGDAEAVEAELAPVEAEAAVIGSNG